MSGDPKLLEIARLKHELLGIQARAVDLHVLDAHRSGWSYREIGRVLGISEEGVHEMVQRERARDEDFWRRWAEAVGVDPGTA